MNTRSKNELKEIKLLGNQNTTYPTDYDPSILEYFENKHPYNDYVVTLDAYEFSSLCVTGDTMIDVACDETKYPTGIPISDLVGTEGYVFGVDEHSLRPVCRKYSDVRCTRKDAPVVKIVMEAIKGASSAGTFHKEITTVKCTPDHPVLVKRGFHDSEWVPASELIPGMRLIADQRCGDTIRSTSRHRLIAENLYQDVLDVHHKDGNHFNNSPGNLINKLKSTHLSDHRLEDYGYEDRLDIETLLQLYNSGENINSIAKMYGCDNSTVESRIGHLIGKRQQSESLKLRNIRLNGERDAEICELYTKGYLISEIGEYIGLHPTRVSEILKQNNVTIRESNFARYNRQKLDLPSLNHKVLAVVDAGTEDVYNMEVEDIHNFFGNGVILHNCPKTGQPDFAKVVISYIPNIKMVESKSLKLYLFSFRNHGDFHEDCVNIIMKDLIKLMDPKYIEVRGIFSPRGGISIFPFCNWSNPKFDYQSFENRRKLDMLKDSSNRITKYDM